MWKTGRGNADFSVRLVRSTMGESFNSANSTDLFVWSKIATPKVNCFAWRAISGGIPTAAALAVRNVCFGDGMCILCGIEAETTDHLLVSCTFAKSVWWLICVWLQVPIPETFVSVTQLLSFCKNLHVGERRKRVVYAIFLLTMWTIWIARNDKIFNKKLSTAISVLDQVKESSYWWVVKRSRISNLSLENWSGDAALEVI
ncbi:putative reverse transcriptase zinc-binding domain-containing protein [Helianthus annuus]|uniref:Reverse transcriptase zinc-binding domain-containing protein n=1 Tax=Helianthus annuus TaxID=4232 RepID=A0A9K3JT01_HELAN|nr:putative reverse transcriptase zinc-binding domain-containing protein [Helianthus annuus]KAJ0610913.1 putative reverse transcriptase zinc-binding domain-containing protein [Helianthus annuus]KAJ0621766.1 putative reverse transcriptase zinc-binding domain-containing protein [Helianthus annuus]KAJ0626170.1 putative reverse transcriptase zinc-binding domain-containing protein [Helianthus annuus]KAJ0782503.1 putative reverse transcriptase zinc-binding domain-containing protein [Helianthus annuus